MQTLNSQKNAQKISRVKNVEDFGICWLPSSCLFYKRHLRDYYYQEKNPRLYEKRGLHIIGQFYVLVIIYRFDFYGAIESFFSLVAAYSLR